MQAFHAVPGLAAADVIILGKDAYGVLLKGIEQERAAAMKSACGAQGIETEVVADSALTELPAARQLNKVEFTADALLIYDLMDRSSPLAWGDISVLAAGRVRMVDFKREVVNRIVTAIRDGAPQVRTTSVTKEEKKDHLLLEIITHGAAQRYHVKADQPEVQLLFRCLGDRRSKEPFVNLTLFVQELATHAPSAVLNHGAFYLRDNSDATFSYPSQTAFYREITWLLWMISSGRAQG
jgi:hypothetical protein